MSNPEILIIGAGAAGLMAARTLAKAGKRVMVLEARDHCGGRIHTVNNIEMGAEFVHGDLPVTIKLLKEAGIQIQPSGDEMLHYKEGKFECEDGVIEDWGLLTDKLKKIKTDLSINEFLEKEFPGEKYGKLKNSVRRFASGYDTADPDKASAFALRNEWLSEDDDTQHRVKGGYGKMISFLEDEYKKAGGNIHLNSTVKEIQWQPGNVKVITDAGTLYTAKKIIIALPLGILQADENKRGAIAFHPLIPKQINAINKMGFGAVIKILLEFDEPFWEDRKTEALAGKSLKTMAFLLSGEEIPTWWTQAPLHSAVLTGWLGGPPAAKKKNLPDEEILQQSLQSLSNIFKRDVQQLQNKLVTFHIMNWTNDPFTRGSYAYDTIAASASRKILNKPVAGTIFFAGEYLYEGAVMGTVEAALTSGEEVAKKIINARLS